MNDSHSGARTDSTLRWGGRAGIAGSILMVVTFFFVAVFVGMDITPAESLTRFADIRASRAVENTLYLAILLLWMLHSLALHQALRRTSPTPALFGTALSILGLVLLAAGAVPHVATASLFDLYQAADATPQDQATLVLVWHGIEAVFEALLYTGLVIVPLALMTLGFAMLGTPHYGRRIGKATIALGMAGLAAAVGVLAGVPGLAPVGVLILLGFHLCLGRKTLQLAHAPKPSMVAAA